MTQNKYSNTLQKVLRRQEKKHFTLYKEDRFTSDLFYASKCELQEPIIVTTVQTKVKH